MQLNNNPRIWEFDVDNTLIMWDLSAFPVEAQQEIPGPKGPVPVVVNKKNVSLLIKLAKIGWSIRVHSGSGLDWAATVVVNLGLEKYVDYVCAKPLGRTDDQPSGDGLAYEAYREPT